VIIHDSNFINEPKFNQSLDTHTIDCQCSVIKSSKNFCMSCFRVTNYKILSATL